jgi:hypothetical protein
MCMDALAVRGCLGCLGSSRSGDLFALFVRDNIAVEEGDVCGVDALIRFSSHLKRPRPRSKAASARDPDPKEAGTT